MPCYPDNCGAGGGPWQTRGSDGYFTINYYFSTGMDATRQNAWLLAIREWESTTCVRFLQSTEMPRVKVSVEEVSTCYATAGYPGDNGEGRVNMGFCKSNQELGSIVHEIGHVLGMTHTQKRPDATGRIWLPDQNRYEGPYLKIYWQNIDSHWQSQYKAKFESYTGSNYQQAGDPWTGYAPYDYSSIMHYARDPTPGKTNFDTVNAAYNGYVGQRSKPSKDDILEIQDMYQCGTAGESGERRRRTPSSGIFDNIGGWFGFGYDQQPGEPDRDQWVAYSWGECTIPEDVEPIPTEFNSSGDDLPTCTKKRQVTCKDMNGTFVSTEKCRRDQRPDEVATCSCLDVCGDWPVHRRAMFHRHGNSVSCHQLKESCDQSVISKVCAHSCGHCAAQLPGGAPRTTNCKDQAPMSSIKIAGVEKTCAELKALNQCSNLPHSPEVRKRCPESCGECKTYHYEESHCKDDADFKDEAGRGCEYFYGFECVSEKVLEACPLSCGKCR